MINSNELLERFLSYLSFNTQSNPNSGKTPSSDGQLKFSAFLKETLERIGLSDVTIDQNGYLMATLPATNPNIPEIIGLIAHMDTSPDYSGMDVSPVITRNYNGGDITLNNELNINLSPLNYPELDNYKGQTIISTNGTTLLGADDKAGIAEIITAMDYFVKNPHIEHGTIRVCFTPDEEIGEGADHFDVAKFNANYAYTIDGGEIGELEYENFNAAAAKITIKGLNIHPGYGYNRMINAQLIAHEFLTLLPNKTPANTTNYEGFYHLTSSCGDVENYEMNFIIRDFDEQLFSDKIEAIKSISNQLNDKYNQAIVSTKITYQYKNMREKIEPCMYIVERAIKAMEKSSVIPKIKPIRGGTDGARLSFMGLPCPNIFTGGHNFHGKHEFIPLESMIKATEVIINIVIGDTEKV